MYSHEDLTAIILSGGQGRRLHGKNKGLITLNDKNMLTHVIDRLKKQTSHIIISANNDISQYQSHGYPVVKDEFTDYQGPLAGILSCHDLIKTPLVLTTPCDTPLLATNLIQKMLKAYNKSHHLCVAHDGIQRQNLFMLFSIKHFSQLRVFFDNKKRKVDDWILSQPYTEVDFSDQATDFTNINTEETLSQVQQILHHNNAQ